MSLAVQRVGYGRGRTIDDDSPWMALLAQMLQWPSNPLPRRILITGSRDWLDRNAVFNVLYSELAKSTIIVVHGDCPTGADRFAHEFCLHFGVHEEPHPAKWWPCQSGCRHAPRYRRDGAPYCPAAGNYRNQEMVDLGASVCHAFPLRDSRGTWHCMRAAIKAGIEVVNHGYSTNEKGMVRK